METKLKFAFNSTWYGFYLDIFLLQAASLHVATSINLSTLVQKYCSFYLHSEMSFETCGPRRDLVDTPRIFIVRYKRNATAEQLKPARKPKSLLDVWQDDEVDPASQLVVRYNGSSEIPQV